MAPKNDYDNNDASVQQLFVSPPSAVKSTSSPSSAFSSVHFSPSPPPPAAVTIIGQPSVVFPNNIFTQQEVGQLLGIRNPVVWKLLKSPHIQTRHLYLPKDNRSTSSTDDSNNTSKMTPLKQPNAFDRHHLFINGVYDIGVKAVNNAIKKQNIQSQDIDILTTVTSTGLALPGLSAMIMSKVPGFRLNTQRMDIAGMGCNAGMSGLRSLSMALKQLATLRNKKCMGMLLCCEINSSFFLNNEDTVGHGIVNSLFGDAAVCVIIQADPYPCSPFASCSPSINPHHNGMMMASPISPCAHRDDDDVVVEVGVGTDDIENSNKNKKISLIDFESLTVTEYFDDMIYLVDKESQLMHFRLSKRIPMAVGRSSPIPVRALLERHGLSPKNVKQWIVHGGGAKVMQLFASNLGLDVQRDLRHTESVMRDCGNLSSGSFLVSLCRLYEEDMEEGVMDVGDVVVFVSMGPGATIEVGLGVVH